MKYLFILSTLLLSFLAQAESVTIYKGNLDNTFGILQADSTFFMDTTTAQGYVNVSVDEILFTQVPTGPVRCDQYGCYPQAPTPTETVFNLIRTRVTVENLKLVGKEMIYLGQNGEVKCGTIGTSRVFRRPTLYLTGNCVLKERIQGDQVTITLHIK